MLQGTLLHWAFVGVGVQSFNIDLITWNTGPQQRRICLKLIFIIQSNLFSSGLKYNFKNIHITSFPVWMGFMWMIYGTIYKNLCSPLTGLMESVCFYYFGGAFMFLTNLPLSLFVYTNKCNTLNAFGERPASSVPLDGIRWHIAWGLRFVSGVPPPYWCPWVPLSQHLIWM